MEQDMGHLKRSTGGLFSLVDFGILSGGVVETL